MVAGHCAPPDCVCRSRTRGRCVRPNRWHIFRRAHRTEFTRAAQSRTYRAALALGPDWCALARELGLARCVPLSGIRGRRSADDAGRHPDPCVGLLADLPPTPARRERQWQQVLRALQTRYRWPANAADYTEAHLARIATVVGEMFFGREFVPALRRAGWRLSVDADGGDVRMDSPAGGTGYRTRRGGGGHWDTFVAASLVDHYVPPGTQALGMHHVSNDGFPVHSRLEWIAHIVAHELVHCLQLVVCGRPMVGDGHDADFQRLNAYLLGARSFHWMPHRLPALRV